LLYEIVITGKVQGVGFRPFIYQLAQGNSITGEVYNSGAGVVIFVKCDKQKLEDLIRQIKIKAPKLSLVRDIKVSKLDTHKNYKDFSISFSKLSNVKTTVPADAGICADCIADIVNKNSRWYNYAFTNCTNCGPRFSIIKSMPYDRKATSMRKFTMCNACKYEYEDPLDRRFHAQPDACPACGPKLFLTDNKGDEVVTDDILDKTAELLMVGKIIAIKGIGGFHLACIATDEEVVDKLRQRKNRPDKPFALMAKDVAMVKEYCELSIREEALLTNAASPIVLLKQKSILAEGIAPGQKRLGFMLPYTPLHYLLMQKLTMPIVLTSGNQVDEPQVITNQDALGKLSHIADFYLTHNRAIVNRVDDSVAQVVAKQTQILRCARGLAPASFSMPKGFENAPNILAVGAELKNTFALVAGDQVIVSQHIGDLKNLEAFNDFQHNIELYKSLYDFQPGQIVCDKHPAYLSAIYAGKTGLELVKVQHHHAHVAASLFEQQKDIVCKKVLGVVWDGIGFGTDNIAWGGEFLFADYKDFERVAHFDTVPLIGGDKAAAEPWRMAFAYLNKYQIKKPDIFVGKPGEQLATILESDLPQPETSAVGRLFDAVAFILGICGDGISYEAQAAIELENLATDSSSDTSYEFDLRTANDKIIIGTEPMWRGILYDLENAVPIEEVAYKFHLSLAKLLVKVCVSLKEIHEFEEIILTGGVFQNKLLLSLSLRLLKSENLKVFTPEKLPPGDACICLGQIAVCAARSLSGVDVSIRNSMLDGTELSIIKQI